MARTTSKNSNPSPKPTKKSAPRTRKAPTKPRARPKKRSSKAAPASKTRQGSASKPSVSKPSASKPSATRKGKPASSGRGRAKTNPVSKDATPARMRARAHPKVDASHGSIAARVKSVMNWLERSGTEYNRTGMARYGIVAKHVFGVSVGELRDHAKQLGRNHELAEALWQTGCYEARMLAAFVDEPARVSAAQMDTWCRNFDNWAICDTLCFHLFDKTPYAWQKVEKWAKARAEFVRRASFALLASLSVHDKTARDTQFQVGLELIERYADDDRNFVKKAVNWALRSIGKKNQALHEQALATAERLALKQDAASRWVGKDALRELRSPGVVRRLAKRRS